MTIDDKSFGHTEGNAPILLGVNTNAVSTYENAASDSKTGVTIARVAMIVSTLMKSGIVFLQAIEIRLAKLLVQT